MGDDEDLGAFDREVTEHEGRTYVAVDFSVEDLRGHAFSDCTFQGCRFVDALFERCGFDDCAFLACDLSTVRIRGVTIRRCAFERCRAMGVDWYEVGLVFTPTFRDCNLQYCTFQGVGMKSTSWDGCDLTEATFRRADLRGATFAGALLGRATFQGCDLRGTDLSGADGVRLDLAANRCKGAVVSVEAALAIATEAGLVVR